MYGVFDPNREPRPGDAVDASVDASHADVQRIIDQARAMRAAVFARILSAAARRTGAAFRRLIRTGPALPRGSEVIGSAHATPSP